MANHLVNLNALQYATCIYVKQSALYLGPHESYIYVFYGTKVSIFIYLCMEIYTFSGRSSMMRKCPTWSLWISETCFKSEALEFASIICSFWGFGFIDFLWSLKKMMMICCCLCIVSRVVGSIINVWFLKVKILTCRCNPTFFKLILIWIVFL